MIGRMKRVQTLLRTREELCSLSDMYAVALSNGRNDVSTLIHRGWIIEKWWTSHDDNMAHVHYRLVQEPAPTGAAVIREAVTVAPARVGGDPARVVQPELIKIGGGWH